LKKWEKPEIIHNIMTEYHYLVQYPENLELGKNFDIGEFCYINANYNVTIEDDVQIGSHCSIYSNSTIDNKLGPVVLKKNCRIGTHSTVMPNVIVGENSIIAGHSFVNCNIPDNEIWGGTPVSFMKKIK
jgi:acetyltransferase-like isoleucine patch superfamily enzyme